MLKSARMRKMRVLVLEPDLEAVVSGLGRLGVIHLTSAHTDLADLNLAGLDTGADVKRWQALRGRIEHLGRILKVDLDAPGASERGFHEPERIEQESLDLEDEVNAWLKRQQELVSRSDELRELSGRVEGFAGLPVPLDKLGEYSFLHFAVGSLPERRLRSLETELGSRAVLVALAEKDGVRKVLAVTTKSGREALESALADHGFKGEKFGEKALGTPDELIKESARKLDEGRRELDDLGRKLDAKGRERADDLRGWHARVRIAEKMADAKGHFARTASTRLIVGWVSARRVPEVFAEVMRLTKDRAAIDVFNPDEHPEEYKNVPTLLDNARWLKPFELLVAGFGIPGYNEIEPTALLAVTFLFMFGAMFGDVGHGLVLVLAGLAVRRILKSDVARQFGSLIAMAGGAGMLGGLVYGSFFGMTEIGQTPMPRLWAEPLTKPETMLMFMVAFGILMVSLGLVLNVVNRLRDRDVAGTFLDRFGLIGMVFYWGSIGLVLRYVILDKGSAWLTALVLGPPIVLMILADVLVALLGGKVHGHGAPEGAPKEPLGMRVFEGAVGTLEAVISYLTNTISFVRVGAFALAHGGLCLAVFKIADMVRESPAGPVGSLAIIVGGNILIIAMEGLVVSIQAMRLEYYEFFTKFFKGGGKAFQPFELER